MQLIQEGSTTNPMTPAQEASTTTSTTPTQEASQEDSVTMNSVITSFFFIICMINLLNLSLCRVVDHLFPNLFPLLIRKILQAFNQLFKSMYLINQLLLL
jgi:hypothetical protein